MAEFKGIDVSRWQGEIDWRKVKASGVDFAMLCISYGTTLDTQFEANLAGVKAAGLPFGVYHFTVALTPEQAREEVRLLTEHLKGEQLNYPVAFDMEDEGSRYFGMKTTQRTSIAEAGLDEIERQGYYAILYTNPTWLANKLNTAALAKYDTWLAARKRTRPTKYTHGIWRYTSTGKVDGISGDVNLDIAYKDYPAIIRAARLNGYAE